MNFNEKYRKTITKEDMNLKIVWNMHHLFINIFTHVYQSLNENKYEII